MSEPRRIKLRLGKIQRLIIEHLLECGGATCTWDMQVGVAMQTSWARFSRFTPTTEYTQISRSAWRLVKRGMLKRVVQSAEGWPGVLLSTYECFAWWHAVKRHPAALMFWVLTDAAMKALEDQEGGK